MSKRDIVGAIRQEVVAFDLIFFLNVSLHTIIEVGAFRRSTEKKEAGFLLGGRRFSSIIYLYLLQLMFVRCSKCIFPVDKLK